ncbi:neutral zinc metallopeptidase [Pseudoruegeria sp. SK021]|uniref:KPN_02809 family neutral zinc metallopeptidase n=1 Tax=Pseudoruegeria sp. SK021 TaxID=1933035 RepID=UPI000A23684C|nr:neutral zinc metallopeptidase [Pseudoruegeria sp. SK021]OSP56877.1 hypothetical protein BV911_02065 [Pseudoruegeria sp. SK021]
MRLRNTRRSSNIDDRRGRGGGGGRIGGIGGLGLLAVLAIGYFTGIDVTPLLQGTQTSQTSGAPVALSPQEQQAGDFAAQVLATTEDVWGEVFPQSTGQPYQPPQMVLFSQVTQSACGGASGATGPFYCPEDKSAYLDTAFFAVLSEQLGAEGDFASAYVIAHEVAHHVQNEVGILAQAQALQAGARAQGMEADANSISVRVELQADCLAGVWAAHVDGLLEPGDLDEALNAARKIGDDYLQRNAGRVPNPHSFTHGTSEQRESWFARGYRNGQMADCDTFSAETL